MTVLGADVLTSMGHPVPGVTVRLPGARMVALRLRLKNIGRVSTRAIDAATALSVRAADGKL
jgi:hypothetical protein